MPWYDYRCYGCGTEFELQRAINRRHDADCPQCRSPRVRRLVRGVGVVPGRGATGGAATGCGPSGRPRIT